MVSTTIKVMDLVTYFIEILDPELNTLIDIIPIPRNQIQVLFVHTRGTRVVAKRKTKKKPKYTLVEKDLLHNECYKAVLNGTMLAIDPSIGSDSSLPGYALFEQGELVESGVFEVQRGASKHIRLYEITRIIREDFPYVPDVLAVERIVARPFRGGSGMNAVSLSSLHKAIGAIMSAAPFTHLVEVATSSWVPYKPDDYEKTDEFDAITIGLCVIGKAKLFRERDDGESDAE